MKSSATATDTKNTFHTATKATKITKVDGLDTHYPPSAPAYCTRSSLKEMEDTSKSLTERELHKLQAQTKSNSLPNYSTDVKCVPAIEFNPDMHRIMCKYADKQQQLCSQNFELTKRLRGDESEAQCKGKPKMVYIRNIPTGGVPLLGNIGMHSLTGCDIEGITNGKGLVPGMLEDISDIADFGGLSLAKWCNANWQLTMLYVGCTIPSWKDFAKATFSGAFPNNT